MGHTVYAHIHSTFSVNNTYSVKAFISSIMLNLFSVLHKINFQGCNSGSNTNLHLLETYFHTLQQCVVPAANSSALNLTFGCTVRHGL